MSLHRTLASLLSRLASALLMWCLLVVTGCAAWESDGSSPRIDDIFKVRLGVPDRAPASLGALPAARLSDDEILRREERLRRDLQLHHSPDGFHPGCYRRDIDPDC